MTPGLAWYQKERIQFLRDPLGTVVGELSTAANMGGLRVEPEQVEEWNTSVGVLQTNLDEKTRMVEVLQETLNSQELADYEHVVLEYDLRRRGLRLDCVLLGKGIIAVIEFKRNAITNSDRDQVADYCVNLMEFHEETRRVADTEGCIVVPFLALTTGSCRAPAVPAGIFHRPPWAAVIREPVQCDRRSLHHSLNSALAFRRGKKRINPTSWLLSRFSPSSTIIDAAISLYGRHEVSSINEHAAPIELINRCTEEVAGLILASKEEKQSRIIFVSGAPGAGKTLVGLKLAFDARFRKDAVFVTGNAPLVEVLSESLKRSYKSGKASKSDSSGPWVSGYAREDARPVIEMSTFKIVKAHSFLGERGKLTGSADGSIVVFDEAQRTYRKGREVLRKKLEDDEAALILDSLDKSYGPGSVILALLGHNQAINRGELGVSAWFKAAKARKWRFAISDETVALSEVADSGTWANEPLRDSLKTGHLPHSLRFYRNSEIEQWADRLLADAPDEAARVAERLNKSGDSIWLTRDLRTAKEWVRALRLGNSAAGIIASAQARRLAAEGLFVELKPDIANWILEPSGDIRSSNMLETVQNQYQIQGLELDYTIVCWDADLRRGKGKWESLKIIGPRWQRDSALEIAKNGYRVLLTRARKGMILFVPRGDLSGLDSTREVGVYDRIADYLITSGARLVAGA